jgi:hypothetical protein
MPPDFTSTFAKLERAEEHFQLLDAEITCWRDLAKDSITFERGAYNTRIGVAVHMEGPPGNFLRWTLMAGDCINNARSALDHLIFAIGEHEAVKYPASDHKRNQFVIADSPTDFDGEAKRRLKNIPVGVLSAIKAVQPFNRPHPVLPPLLRLLRKFSNADKHRLLELAQTGVMVTGGTFSGDTSKGSKTVYVLPHPVSNNDIVCVIESEQPDPNLKLHNFSVSLDVCIWHDLRDGETNPINGRTGYGTLLMAILAEVRYVIDTVRNSIV